MSDVFAATLRKVAAFATAVMLVTHRTEASARADRVLRLDQGRLVAS